MRPFNLIRNIAQLAIAHPLTSIASSKPNNAGRALSSVKKASPVMGQIVIKEQTLSPKQINHAIHKIDAYSVLDRVLQLQHTAPKIHISHQEALATVQEAHYIAHEHSSLLTDDTDCLLESSALLFVANNFVPALHLLARAKYCEAFFERNVSREMSRNVNDCENPVLSLSYKVYFENYANEIMSASNFSELASAVDDLPDAAKVILTDELRVFNSNGLQAFLRKLAAGNLDSVVSVCLDELPDGLLKQSIHRISSSMVAAKDTEMRKQKSRLIELAGLNIHFSAESVKITDKYERTVAQVAEAEDAVSKAVVNYGVAEAELIDVADKIKAIVENKSMPPKAKVMQAKRIVPFDSKVYIALDCLEKIWDQVDSTNVSKFVIKASRLQTLELDLGVSDFIRDLVKEKEQSASERKNNIRKFRVHHNKSDELQASAPTALINIADLQDKLNRMNVNFRPKILEATLIDGKVEVNYDSNFGYVARMKFPAMVDGVELIWEYAVALKDGLGWVNKIKLASEYVHVSGLNNIIGDHKVAPLLHYSQSKGVPNESRKYLDFLSGSNSYIDTRKLLAELPSMRWLYASNIYRKVMAKADGLIAKYEQAQGRV